jgi:beta-N-acetylhexosaminidase
MIIEEEYYLRKKYILIAALLMLLSTAAGYSLNFKGSTNDKTAQEKPPQTETEDNASKSTEGSSETKPVDPIKEEISKMSLDEKIGQMLIAGIDGYSLGSSTKSLIEKYKVGGFIALGENVKDTKQLLNLLNSIRQENLKNKIPLFVSVDEEGGRITRMSSEFKRFPTNKAIGEVKNQTFSYKIGIYILVEYIYETVTMEKSCGMGGNFCCGSFYFKELWASVCYRPDRGKLQTAF